MIKISHSSNYEVVCYNFRLIVQVYELVVNNPSTYNKLMTWIFRITFYTLKSYTMQVM